NCRIGSSPASPDSCPADGSMTSGVPKKSRTSGQSPGKLICRLPGCRTGLAAQQASHPCGRSGIRSPARTAGRRRCAGPTGLVEVSMTDVTRILSAIEAGDPHAAEQLLPLVYDELRKLAAARMVEERADHTLQPTALVHEAYLRLVAGGQPHDW